MAAVSGRVDLNDIERVALAVDADEDDDSINNPPLMMIILRDFSPRLIIQQKISSMPFL